MKKLNSPEESKYRKYSRLIIIGLGLVLLFLGYRAGQLKFDYDFEKFFPQENNTLSFFKDYRETFESDNDFILIGLQNEAGLFESDFLKKVAVFTDSIRKLPHLREVVSPLEISYYEINPMGFGMLEKSFFHPDQPSRFKEDSLNLVNSKHPISEMVNLENNSLIIVVKNTQMISKMKSDELAEALQQTVDEFNFDQLHVMGKIMGQNEYIKIMKVEFLTFMLISIVVLIVFLWITYRSLWGILIPLMTVLLAVIGSLGFMELSGTPLNMMTTLLPVIMLVVGMSDVVHLVSKYLEEIRMGRTKIPALKNMIKKVGVATFLTSLTTALGFFTLVGVKMQPVRDFGVFTAVGVLLAFILSILFIPSIFMLMKKPTIINAQRLKNRWERVMGSLFLLLCRQRNKVLIGFAILTLLFSYGASKIQFDYYLMQDLSEDQPMMKELRYFQNQFGGIRPFELAIIPKDTFQINDYKVLKQIEQLENYLQEEYGVNQMVSPTLPYKFLNQALRSGKSEYYMIPENPKRFAYLKKQMKSVEGREEWREMVSEDGKLGRIYGRMVDPGSREMIDRNDALDHFIQEKIDTSVIDYRLTGTTVIIDESGRYVSKNIILGLLIAFGIIALAMGLLFKSVKMAFLSLIPNLFPILITAGFIGFAGIDLNMSTAIVFTIAFGIAVDDTIHFLSRYFQEMKKGRSRLYGLRRTYISTGKAIIITTVILLGGFGSLLFSDFLSTFYIGLFVSMTLLFAMITDLTLLPLLLLGSKKNRSKTTI